MSVDTFIPMILEMLTLYGLKIIAALLILIIGRWLAKLLNLLVKKVMIRSELDDMLISFISPIVYGALLVIVIIAALNQLGIQTTSFIAIIGAAGLAIGLALQGSLSNFASGVLLIAFRPFNTGDYIEGAGVNGTVETIQLFSTILKTPDNKSVIVPNAKLMNDNIINYSAKDTRRVDLVIGVSYSDDLKIVRELLLNIIGEDDRILDEPHPTVAVFELADSSINFAVRPWVKTADYWNVYFDLLMTIKQSFDREGISIPFPQHDIHLFQQQQSQSDKV